MPFGTGTFLPQKTMGLFNFSKSKSSIPKEDLVWKDQPAKWAGALQYIQEHPQARVLTWSERTRQEAERLFEQNNLVRQVDLAGRVLPSRLYNEPLIFLEHHLHAGPETKLLKQAKPKKAVFLNALDDPLFIAIGNHERLMRLVENLGMEEGENLQSPLITKSIYRGQHKLETKPKSLPLEVQEWFDRII